MVLIGQIGGAGSGIPLSLESWKACRSIINCITDLVMCMKTHVTLIIEVSTSLQQERVCLQCVDQFSEGTPETSIDKTATSAWYL